MTRPFHIVSATAITLLVTIGNAQNPYPAAILPTSCQFAGSTAIGQTGTADFTNILADLDQDGDDDLIGSTTAGFPPALTGGISVCKAAGGTFLPGVCYPVPPGAFPSRFAAADLDLDGDKDIVVFCVGTFPLRVLSFLNDGTGAFPAPPIVAILLSSSFITLGVGRLNADMFPDVFLGSSGGTSLIFPGVGNGTFGPGFPGPTTTSGSLPVLRDDDLDGDDDVHESTGSPTWSFVTYRNNLGAGFSPIVRFAVGTNKAGYVTFGDFNLDGNLDAAVVGSDSGLQQAFVLVALGNGAGTFTPGAIQSLAPLTSLLSFAQGDFDGDGDPDLVATGLTTTFGLQNQAVIQATNVAGGFPAATLAHRMGDYLLAGDVNGDGFQDVLIGTGPNWALLPGIPSTGSGLAHPKTVSIPLGGRTFEVADLNADGRPDAIVGWQVPQFGGTPTSAGIAVVLDIETATGVSQTIMTNTVALDMATADWNRDGILDVLLMAAGLGAGNLQMLLGTAGGTLSAPVTLATGVASNQAVPADVNKDGIPDVITVSQTAVTTWFGDGLGGLGSPVSSTVCPTPVSPQCIFGPLVAVNDLDGDGNVDVVITNPFVGQNYGDLSIFLGNGTGAFTRISSTIIFKPQRTPIVEDLNGDRIPDIINPAHAPSYALEVLLGLGGGTFAAASYYPTKNVTTNQAALVDFNGDGFPDVALGNGQIFRNDGLGGLVLAGSLMSEGIEVAGADANRDLQRDVVGFSQNGWLTVFDNLSVCPGTGYAYGIGCPGSGGFVPELSARGCTTPGGTLTLNVGRAVGASPNAMFVVGPGPANVPVGSGCTALIQIAGSFLTPFPISGPAAPGQGWSTLSVGIPPSMPLGTTVAVQAIVLDPGSVFGWSATNALGLTFQ